MFTSGAEHVLPPRPIQLVSLLEFSFCEILISEFLLNLNNAPSSVLTLLLSRKQSAFMVLKLENEHKGHYELVCYLDLKIF